MNLVDRYILREWLVIFGLVLGATVGLVLMQALYDNFRDLLDAGASGSDVAFYFLVRVPRFFSVVLPLALLVSLLYSLGRLHRGNEIIALRAAGLGLFEITRSLWVSGLILCGVSWWLNASVIPWSIERSDRMLDRLRYQQLSQTVPHDRVGVVKSVAFDNQREHRMWFMNRYSPFLARGYGVSVAELDADRREKTRIVAREAYRDPQRGYWVFKDGREDWFDSDTGEMMRTVAFKEKAVPHFREDPALMLVFDRKPGDLSFVELKRILDYFALDANPKITLYATRYYGLWADTLGPLIILALAIPFAVSGVRVNPVVGVSKSLGLFVLYYGLVQASYALGGRDLMPPMIAALLPNVVMLVVGLWFFLRIR
ncbi:MAG: LptF/LptG family permease [Opitutaceae bacterium]|nr:LptF/LptG family permease [Opitutaceae bacterium]